MYKLLVTLLLCLATLTLGGCADRGEDSRSGPSSSPSGASSGQETDRNSQLENCVTAVGADRDNCKAK